MPYLYCFTNSLFFKMERLFLLYHFPIFFQMKTIVLKYGYFRKSECLRRAFCFDHERNKHLMCMGIQQGQKQGYPYYEKSLESVVKQILVSAKSIEGQHGIAFSNTFPSGIEKKRKAEAHPKIAGT